MSRIILVSTIVLITSCYWNNDKQTNLQPVTGKPDSLKIVSDISPPPGFKRMTVTKNSFGEWLRGIATKKDRHVYLYNGSLKRNQRAQFVVLDISVGNKDLQQCADAMMRLRAEYLFSQKEYNQIAFRDNAGKYYKWTGGANRQDFDKYLEKVFAMCGSASLEKQLHPVAFEDMQPGDVLIRGGFPGHAMIVIDMAIDANGNKLFMLAQSYMPAQDIHIHRSGFFQPAS